MTDAEQRLLHALAVMARQYLEDRPFRGEGVLDSLSMSAGEEAIEVLAGYGLVSMEPGQVRFGKWTQAGYDFLDSNRHTTEGFDANTQTLWHR